MKRHMFAGAAAVAATALLLTGCSGTSSPGTGSSASGSTASGSAASSDITLAGVYENTGDPYWNSVVCGAVTEAKAEGVKLTISSIPTQDEAKLSTTLDTALLSKPTGLLFNPIDTSSWASKVTSIMAAGTPVITTTADLTKNQWSYVQANQDGSQFASDVQNIVGSETGSAVVLKGLASASWQTERLGGITSAVKANTKLQFLTDQIDGFDINKGTQLITSLITAHPDLKLILAVAGPEGQAAAAAVKQSGNSGKIHVIAFDAVPAEQQAVKDGTIDMLIAQPAALTGKTEVQKMVAYLKGSDYKAGAQPADGLKNILPLGKITKDNIGSSSVSDYLYKTSCS